MWKFHKGQNINIFSNNRISNSATLSHVGASGELEIGNTNLVFIENTSRIMDFFALIFIPKYCVKIFIKLDHWGFRCLLRFAPCSVDFRPPITLSSEQGREEGAPSPGRAVGGLPALAEQGREPSDSFQLLWLPADSLTWEWCLPGLPSSLIRHVIWLAPQIPSFSQSSLSQYSAVPLSWADYDPRPALFSSILGSLPVCHLCSARVSAQRGASTPMLVCVPWSWEPSPGWGMGGVPPDCRQTSVSRKVTILRVRGSVGGGWS